MPVWLSLALALGGCLVNTDAYEARKAELTDDDGDGFTEVDGDCDDGDPAVGPGMAEVCDGVDQDCDGEVDEGAVDSPFWYRDADGDGWGELTREVQACEAPGGHVADPGDCDDGDGGVFPGQAEVPYDGVDDDCSGADLTDVDGDGVAAAAAGGMDCDDADPGVYPGAESTWASGATDNDCDGELEEVDTTFGVEGWTGRSAGAGAGLKLASAGDVDGDGTADFLVAAPYDAGRFETGGAVHLVLDGATPESLSEVPTLEAGAAWQYLGGAVVLVDPLSDSGEQELLVSTTGWGGQVGAVWSLELALLLEGDTVYLEELGDPLATGSQPGDFMGGTVVSLGDVTGDGVADVGMSTGTLEAGGISGAGLVGIASVSDWSGTTPEDQAWALGGWFEGHGLGAHLAAVPDVDGDGTHDIFVTANDGVLAMILAGGVEAPDDPEAEALWVLFGEVPNPGLGRIVGDLDGDGQVDVAFAEDARLTIYTGVGVQPWRTLDVPSAEVWLEDGELGAPVELGDLDGDGLDELWLAAAWDETLGSGAAAIHPSEGWASGSSRHYLDAPLRASTPRAFAGIGVAAERVGDVDGDGVDELLLGGPWDNEAGSSAGVAVLLDLPQ